MNKKNMYAGEQNYSSDPREKFIDARVERFCNQGMDYWDAVKIAEKQAKFIEQYKGIFPTKA